MHCVMRFCARRRHVAREVKKAVDAYLKSRDKQRLSIRVSALQQRIRNLPQATQLIDRGIVSKNMALQNGCDSFLLKKKP